MSTDDNFILPRGNHGPTAPARSRCRIGWFVHRKQGTRVPAACGKLTCRECRDHALERYAERLRPFEFAPSILTLTYATRTEVVTLLGKEHSYTKSVTKESSTKATCASLKLGLRTFMRFIARHSANDLRFAWCRRLHGTVILTDLILTDLPVGWQAAATRNGFRATSTRSDDVITDWVWDRLARSAADTRLPAHTRRAQTNCPKPPTTDDWLFIPSWACDDHDNRIEVPAGWGA